MFSFIYISILIWQLEFKTIFLVSNQRFCSSGKEWGPGIWFFTCIPNKFYVGSQETHWKSQFCSYAICFYLIQILIPRLTWHNKQSAWRWRNLSVESLNDALKLREHSMLTILELNEKLNKNKQINGLHSCPWLSVIWKVI